jgi:hypothetical protein
VSITIHPETEKKLRERAEAEGLSIEAYIESLVLADQRAEDELEALAIEGLESGEPVEGGPAYWQEKHRRLDERLEKTAPR